MDILNVSCTAENSVGSVTSSVKVTVTRSPGQLAISGPESLGDGQDGNFLCSTNDLGSPPADISWTVTGKAGGEVGFVQVDTATEASQIQVSPSRQDREITIMCSAINPVNITQAALTTLVTYPPTKISLTAPSSIQSGDPIQFHCSTDQSIPAVSMVWSLTGKVVEDVAIAETGVESHSTLFINSTKEWNGEQDVECCVASTQICDSRSITVNGPVPLVMLDPAGGDGAETGSDEIGELKTAARSQKSAMENILDYNEDIESSDAIDSTVGDITVDTNNVKEKPVSVDRVALMLTKSGGESRHFQISRWSLFYFVIFVRFSL